MDQAPASLGPAAASPLSVLEAEAARLENAAAKLKQSNAELRSAMEEGEAGEAEWRTYREAINENLPVIAKYVARAEALREEIEKCKGGGGGGPSEPERMAVEGEGPPPPPPGQASAGEGVWL